MDLGLYSAAAYEAAIADRERTVEERHLRIDELERRMLKGPLVFPGYVHRFTPGLYIRETIMPAGHYQTTKVHASEHPFVVLTGRASIYNPEDGSTVELTAGHVGITKPGTRRVLFTPVECRWVTFHALSAEEEALRVAGALDEEIIAAVERRIIARRELEPGHTSHELFLEELKAREIPEEVEDAGR